MFVLLICVSLISYSPGHSLNANEYCADLNPQTLIEIEQLMGMWYAVEIISHKPEELHSSEEYVRTCPVMYISDDKSTTTLTPLHKSYINGQPYGSGYASSVHGSYNDVKYYTESPTYSQYETGYRRDINEDMQRYGTRGRQHRVRRKYLQLVWTEIGNRVEYYVSYTNKQPGVWFSSGPQNGSSLQSQYDNFAGTIQVLKAIGYHLVLTFCFRLPDPKLYSVIFSRTHKLEQWEIISIHNLLTRKGLETTYVRKACNHNSSARFYVNTLLLLFILCFRHILFMCS